MTGGWRSPLPPLLGALVVVALVAMATPARAQLAGDLVRGQSGLASGTQAPVGLVLSAWVYDYYASIIKGPDGNTLLTSGHYDSLSIPGVNLWWVSPWKLLGASYGAVLSLWGTTPVTDAPRFGTSSATYGFGDDTIPTGFGPVLPGIVAARDWNAGVGLEIDFNWNASDAVTARWVQGLGGKNTTDGSTFYLGYNHEFAVGGKPPTGSS